MLTFLNVLNWTSLQANDWPSKHTHIRPSYQNLLLWTPSSCWHYCLMISQFSLWSSLSLPAHQFSLLPSRDLALRWPLSPHSPHPTHLASFCPHSSSLPFPAEPFHLGEAVASLPDTDLLLGLCSTTSAVHNCTHYIPKSLCGLL